MLADWIPGPRVLAGKQHISGECLQHQGTSAEDLLLVSLSCSTVGKNVIFLVFFFFLFFFFLEEGFTGSDLEAFPVFANKTASLSVERWKRNLRNVGALCRAALEFLPVLPLNAPQAMVVLHISACFRQRNSGTQQLIFHQNWQNKNHKEKKKQHQAQ